MTTVGALLTSPTPATTSGTASVAGDGAAFEAALHQAMSPPAHSHSSAPRSTAHQVGSAGTPAGGAQTGPTGPIRDAAQAAARDARDASGQSPLRPTADTASAPTDGRATRPAGESPAGVPAAPPATGARPIEAGPGATGQSGSPDQVAPPEGDAEAETTEPADAAVQLAGQALAAFMAAFVALASQGAPPESVGTADQAASAVEAAGAVQATTEPSTSAAPIAADQPAGSIDEAAQPAPTSPRGGQTVEAAVADDLASLLADLAAASPADSAALASLLESGALQPSPGAAEAPGADELRALLAAIADGSRPTIAAETTLEIAARLADQVTLADPTIAAAAASAATTEASSPPTLPATATAAASEPAPATEPAPTVTTPAAPAPPIAFVPPAPPTSAPAPRPASTGASVEGTASAQPIDPAAGRQSPPALDVAASAAQIAQALTAASGVATQPAAASRASLDDAIAAAQSLASVAEAGQQLDLTSATGSSRVTVQLDPDSLGSVRLDVQRTAAGVTVSVVADTPAARRAVEANLDGIASALRAAGVQVDDLRIAGPATAPPAPVAASAPAPGPAAAAAAPAPTPSDEVVAAGETEPVEDLPAASSEAASPTVPVAQTAPSGGAARAASVAPAAAPSGADGVQLVKQIAEQIGLLGGQGKSDFQLQLNPASLGRLHVRLTMEDGAMTVRMTAQSSEARSAIESNLGQLRQSFQEQGIRVDRFVVVAGQASFGQDNQHPRRSRGWVDEQRSARRAEGEVDFAQTLAAVGASRSLDYRA